MGEIIKVEHEDELATAERPAFYVMGVGHGHIYDERVTTYSLMVNEKLINEYKKLLAEFMTSTDCDGNDVRAYHNEMKRLLIGPHKPGESCSISQSVTDHHIFFALHKKPEKTR